MRRRKSGTFRSIIWIAVALLAIGMISACAGSSGGGGSQATTATAAATTTAAQTT